MFKGRKFSTLLALLFIAVTLTVLGYGQVFGLVSTSTENNNEHEISPAGFLFIDSANDISYYEKEDLLNLLEGTADSPTKNFSSLSDVTFSSQILNIVFIKSDDIIASFSDSEKSILMAFFSDGFPIGTTEPVINLRSVLGINDSSSNPFALEADVVLFVFSDGKQTFEKTITVSDSIGDVFSSVVDWVHRVKDTKSSSQAGPAYYSDDVSGAWNSNYTKEYEATFDGGTGRFLINAYQLSDSSSSYDWYLFTFSIQSAISSYDSSTGHCGWFTSEMQIKAVVGDSGTLYDYMPTTTVGSTSTGFSIGGGLSTSDAGLSAEYSESYSIDDASYVDNSDYTTETAQWTIEFTGPDYTWYPWYDEPPSSATNSYQTDPAMIAQVNDGSCVYLDVYPKIRQDYDSLSIDWFTLDVSTTYTWWYDTDTYGPLEITVCP